jgi:hypothetical protein
MIQAAEMAATAQNMSPSKWQQFVYAIKERFLMGAAVAAVCGLWYVVDFVFYW